MSDDRLDCVDADCEALRMSVIRWLFGRSKFSRIDMIALLTLIVAAEQWQWAWWQAALAFFIFDALSAVCEIVIFGENYHRLSDAGQRVAERGE